MSNTLIRHTLCSLVLLCFLGTCVASHAAPVTFAFEAEITEITPSADVGFTLPSEFALGESLDGLVTFEPPFTFGQDTENASLSISIGGISLDASGLTFETEKVGFTTGNSTVIENRVLLMSESSSTGIFTLPASLEVSQLALLIVGDSSTVNPLVDRIEDAAVLNRFEERRLLIDIQSESAVGDYRITAKVGPAMIIPEPASLTSASIALASVLLSRRRRNK